LIGQNHPIIQSNSLYNWGKYVFRNKGNNKVVILVQSAQKVLMHPTPKLPKAPSLKLGFSTLLQQDLFFVLHFECIHYIAIMRWTWHKPYTVTVLHIIKLT